MKHEFELTDVQLAELLNAAKPTPVMYLSGGQPMVNSPQENANAAWQKLGRELGFDWLTVRPVHGKNHRFFSANTTEVR